MYAYTNSRKLTCTYNKHTHTIHTHTYTLITSHTHTQLNKVTFGYTYFFVLSRRKSPKLNVCRHFCTNCLNKIMPPFTSSFMY